MERNDANTYRKSAFASQDRGIGKSTTAMMTGRCFESEHRQTREIVPEIRGSRAYDSRAGNQVSRVVVLLVVTLGTCSALPVKPTRKANKKETTTAAAMQQERDAESMEDPFMLRQRLAIMAAGAW